MTDPRAALAEVINCPHGSRLDLSGTAGWTLAIRSVTCPHGATFPAERGVLLVTDPMIEEAVLRAMKWHGEKWSDEFRAAFTATLSGALAALSGEDTDARTIEQQIMDQDRRPLP